MQKLLATADRRRGHGVAKREMNRLKDIHVIWGDPGKPQALCPCEVESHPFVPGIAHANLKERTLRVPGQVGVG